MQKTSKLTFLYLIWLILIFFVESIIVYLTGIRHQKRLNKRIQSKLLAKKALNRGINILNPLKAYRVILKKTLSNMQLKTLNNLKYIKYELSK